MRGEGTARGGGEGEGKPRRELGFGESGVGASASGEGATVAGSPDLRERGGRGWGRAAPPPPLSGDMEEGVGEGGREEGGGARCVAERSGEGGREGTERSGEGRGAATGDWASRLYMRGWGAERSLLVLVIE